MCMDVGGLTRVEAVDTETWGKCWRQFSVLLKLVNQGILSDLQFKSIYGKEGLKFYGWLDPFKVDKMV